MQPAGVGRCCSEYMGDAAHPAFRDHLVDKNICCEEHEDVPFSVRHLSTEFREIGTGLQYT